MELRSGSLLPQSERGRPQSVDSTLVDWERERLRLNETQRSRGRQIRRPGTRKLVLGRIILPRDDSRDARFFRRETSQSSHLYLDFVVY